MKPIPESWLASGLALLLFMFLLIALSMGSSCQKREECQKTCRQIADDQIKVQCALECNR